MQTRLWYIKNTNIFSWLAEDEQKNIAERSEMVSCRRNSNFFFADETSDDIYLIKQRVRQNPLSHHPDHQPGDDKKILQRILLLIK